MARATNAACALPIALGLLLCLATLNFAQTPRSGSETRVLALENAWGQAEKLGDGKALNDLLDDSLVYVRYNGVLWTKAQYIASLSDRHSREDEAVNETMTAHVFGDTVLVTGIYRVKGIEKGKPYARRERFIDTWNFHDGSWRCVASQVTLLTGDVK